MKLLLYRAFTSLALHLGSDGLVPPVVTSVSSSSRSQFRSTDSYLRAWLRGVVDLQLEPVSRPISLKYCGASSQIGLTYPWNLIRDLTFTWAGVLLRLGQDRLRGGPIAYLRPESPICIWAQSYFFTFF